MSSDYSFEPVCSKFRILLRSHLTLRSLRHLRFEAKGKQQRAQRSQRTKIKVGFFLLHWLSKFANALAGVVYLLLREFGKHRQ
jgi:hypothetical protein